MIEKVSSILAIKVYFALLFQSYAYAIKFRLPEALNIRRLQNLKQIRKRREYLKRAGWKKVAKDFKKESYKGQKQ